MKVKIRVFKLPLYFTIIYWISTLIYYFNNYLSALVLLCYGMFLAYQIMKRRDYLNLVHISLLVNSIILGLQELQLLVYQDKLSTTFFLLNYLGNVMLVVGFILGDNLKINNQILDRINSSKIKIDKIYKFVIIATLIAVISFILSTLITGVIAIFSNSITAYQDKYSKFVILEVAMMPAAGLAYYCFTQKELKKRKKVIMILCMIVHVIVLPGLNVSRGVLMTAAVMIFPTIYFYSKNKGLVLKITSVILLIVFVIFTNSRNYTDEYIAYFFGGRDIVIGEKHYKIDGNFAFIYGYLTVSNDNFNYNIEKLNDYSYGAATLRPINVLLKSKKLDNMLEESKLVLIKPGLTTHSMIGYTYYDLGVFGVTFLMMLYGVFYGIISNRFRNTKSPISALMYGSCLINIVLGFFSNWMMNFDWWLWIIMDIIILFILKVRINK